MTYTSTFVKVRCVARSFRWSNKADSHVIYEWGEHRLRHLPGRVNTYSKHALIGLMHDPPVVLQIMEKVIQPPHLRERWSFVNSGPWLHRWDMFYSFHWNSSRPFCHNDGILLDIFTVDNLRRCFHYGTVPHVICRSLLYSSHWYKQKGEESSAYLHFPALQLNGTHVFQAVHTVFALCAHRSSNIIVAEMLSLSLFLSYVLYYKHLMIQFWNTPPSPLLYWTSVLLNLYCWL